MNNRKSIFQQSYLVFSVSLVVAGLTSYPISVLAESTKSNINSNFHLANLARKPKLDFSGTGRPNRQTDAASRGNCDGIERKELTALVPKTATWALTVSEYPTFWVYVPNYPRNIKYVELVLQDEAAQKTLDRTQYTIQSTPGIVGVTLPSKPQNALQQDKVYNWYFRLVCNSGKSFDVGGSIKRVSLSSAITNDYQSYLDNRIWYDALTNLAERRRQNPQDPTLKQEWVDLLKTEGIGLERLGQESNFGSVIPQS